MEEIIEKTENLIKVLDQDERILRIKDLNKKIKKDEKLCRKLEDYKISNKENLKAEIINNSLFREYKKAETDINVLIFEINSKLKEIKEKGQCC